MIIVITGTSKGIGSNLANYYLNMGHTVIGCSRGEKTISHDNYTHYLVNLEKEKDMLDFSKKVREKFKYIDVLINNAGIASMNHFLFTPLATAKKIMDINFFAPFSLSRAFINCLKKSKNPRIINFSTVAVPYNLDGELAYVSSKSAVEELTKILAKELAQFKITVNAIGPTPVKTALIEKVPANKIQDLIDRQAIKRFGEFEDICNVIDFYINPRSDFITGQILYLGGVFK